MSELALAASQDGMDLGDTLAETSVRSGLRELNPGLHFDVVAKHNQFAPLRSQFFGVFYQGRHICSMDRGVMPEFLIWDTTMGWTPIDMQDAERYDDAKVAFVQILPEDPCYHDALLAAEQKSDQFKVDDDGILFRYDAYRWHQVKQDIIRAGWRRSFEILLRSRVPGITRESLGRKFKVDLYKYVGKRLPELTMASM